MAEKKKLKTIIVTLSDNDTNLFCMDTLLAPRVKLSGPSSDACLWLASSSAYVHANARVSMCSGLPLPPHSTGVKCETQGRAWLSVDNKSVEGANMVYMAEHGVLSPQWPWVALHVAIPACFWQHTEQPMWNIISNVHTLVTQQITVEANTYDCPQFCS